MTSSTRLISTIVVGDRHRRDLGGIEPLADNIAKIGLLQPIAVTSDGQLVAGQRRLEAAKHLGWNEIPVFIKDDLDAIVRGEFAENTFRKDFTLSEAVAIKRALEPLEREAARERQGARNDKHLENFSTSSSGRALDKIAAVAGKHRTTIAKAEAVVDAAKAEPEKFGKLLADMDRSGRVNGVFKRLRVAQQAVLIRAEPPPLPGRGPYRVGVIDFPWPYETRQEDPSHRAARPYPTMSIDQILTLAREKLSPLMHPDAILWLWITNYHLIRFAAPVLDAAGFRECSILTWTKSNFGTGDWIRSQTEHCIMAVRGKPVVTLTNESTWLHAPLRAHSQKPVEFYELVESLCAAPRYADLFSRYQHNDKWDCHGDQAPLDDAVAQHADRMILPVEDEQ
jgi:N6-adenosine-specific RNA methylase IME4/ParB-like chromosome segregation protein Spo0J